MAVKLRDKKITIYKGQTVDAGGLMPDLHYVPIHYGRLWAHVRQTSEMEVRNTAGEYSMESIVVTIAWRTGLDSALLYVEYNGTFYDVKRVDTYEGYKDTITLTCDKMAHQPKVDKIESYS